MGSINPINVNTAGIAGAKGFGAQPKKSEEKEIQKEAQSQNIEQKEVGADKVFDYMSANAASVVPQKTINPAKYVDSESAARIAQFMQGFEDKVSEGLKAFEKEFEGIEISENAKMSVVLGKIDKEM